MAQNVTETIDSDTFIRITSGTGVSRVTFQNVGDNLLLIKGTEYPNTPSNGYYGAIEYAPGEGERNVLLTDLFPGISNVNDLYAYSEKGTRVFISHA